MEVRMVNHLQGVLCDKSLMAPTAKQAIFYFGIIISIRLFHVNVLSISIPKNFVLVILDFILLLVKNCMTSFSQNSVRTSLL
jgi:hypothetical protein